MAWQYFIQSHVMLLICVFVCVRGHETTRVIDLTHAQSPETLYWPGDPGYNFTILYRGKSSFASWYENNYFGTAEHAGTHLDSPVHFSEGSWRSQQIPIERLIGPGVILDVTEKASANPDYRVTVQDLRDWEYKHGAIPHGAIVIMNSGWDKHYPNKSKTFGSNTPSDDATFHVPGFHEDAADWLVRYRSIHVVGVDTPSTDYGQSKTFPVHVILGKANIPGLENVANLGKLPARGSTIFVAVIKLYDGSGGPARTFATITDRDDVSPAIFLFPNSRFLFVIYFMYLLLCVVL